MYELPNEIMRDLIILCDDVGRKEEYHQLSYGRVDEIRKFLCDIFTV